MTEMRNRLYTGHVRHKRNFPKVNSFRYAVYYLFVDLAQLDDLGSSLRLFSHNQANLFSLHDVDHGPRDGSPLLPWITELVARVGIDIADGRVMLLTFPRVLGFKFFPVSFWYCFSADGEPRAILAEVQNTFGDHHNYLLHMHGKVFDWRSRPTVTKVFHVSPFIEMDAKYEFHLTAPRQKLAVSIHDYVKGEFLLFAGVSLTEQRLTDGSLIRALLRAGPISLRAWIFIHWQAIRIVAKRIRYIPRTPPPQEETSL